MGLHRRQLVVVALGVFAAFIALTAASGLAVPSDAVSPAGSDGSSRSASNAAAHAAAFLDALVATVESPALETPAPSPPPAHPESLAAPSAPAAEPAGLPVKTPLATPATRPTARSKDSGGAATGQERDRRVELASLIVRTRFDWTRWLPGWRVEFLGPRRGYQGSTFPRERLVQVYVRPTMSVDQIAHVLAHELGHAVDVVLLDDTVRGAINIARGRDATAMWWVDAGATDFASGSGDWAELFSWWASGGRGKWASRLGPPPSPIELVWLEALVRTAVITG